MHYHFIGIGGIGMGTLASLLLAKGHSVSGSDLKDNELTSQLRRAGAKITIGHHASNVKTPDYVVYSSAIRMTNPEMIETGSRKIPLLKRAQLLAQLVNEEKGITIAGAHGKTTTTSMISCLLINAGIKPTTAVGGIINNGSYNASLGEGKYFVAEADESDGTFLYFQPHISVITNIDFEHVDFYKNWDGIMDSWGKFIRCTRPGGCVIAFAGDERLKKLVVSSGVKAVFYGLTNDCDFWAEDIKCAGYRTTFTARMGKETLGSFNLSVAGAHNVLNALACIAVGKQLGISEDVIRKTLVDFTGVRRRFQLKGEVDGIMVVDDYGHHPTEITATINAARSFSPKRLLVAFQPHRYSRTKFLLDEFVQSLSLADELVITDIYAASEKISEGVGTNVIVEKLAQAMGSRVKYCKKEEIVPHLLPQLHRGDLMLFLGAGDIYQLSDSLVEQLHQRTNVGVTP